MARFPEHVKQEIRLAIDLVGLIGQDGVELRRAGRDFRGKCPFEPNTTNTSKFSVTGDSYKCFGCGESGDVFTWLQKRRGLEFREALSQAANIAGIDVEVYLKPDHVKVDPRRESAQNLLGFLAETSRSTALALSPAERVVDGLDLTPLIESGEIGLFPSKTDLGRAMNGHGFGRQASRDVGLSGGAADALCGRWIVWARSGDRIWAGRPLSEDEPIIGQRGRRSTGWAGHTKGRAQARLDGNFLLASSDRAYVALRSRGVMAAYRAVTHEALHRPERFPVRGLIPTLVVEATPDGRKEAYRLALVLLKSEPRLRVIEIPSPSELPADPDEIREYLLAASENAGTVLDWQCEMLAVHGTLDSEDGRLRAHQHLARLVAAVQAPVEREAYRQEVIRLTGHELDVGPISPDTTTPSNSRERTSPGTPRSMT